MSDPGDSVAAAALPEPAAGPRDLRSLDPGARPTALDARARAVARERLARRFQVVAGKGGVGRSVVAAALAARLAAQGRRVLLVEVNAPDSAARYLGVEPSIDEPREVLENLWLCRMTPAGALKEYALLVLRFRALYSLVFENRLVKYLLRSIPSLAEFTMMGKVWYHAQQEERGRPRFDHLIMDAPATGHAVTMLGVSRLVAETVPSGLMQDAANKMAALIEDPGESCLHVVTLPEEMPVTEGLELMRTVQGRLRMAPGVGFVNRALSPLVDPAERSILAALEATASAELAPYLVAARTRLFREGIQGEHSARFVAALAPSSPALVLPELSGALSSPELTRTLGACISRLVDDVSPLAGGANA